MSETGFAAVVTKEEAWRIVEAKVPILRQTRTELRHHPFSGFVHRFSHPILKNSPSERLHTLVDRLTGSAFISDPWSAPIVFTSTCHESKVSDPDWNTITFEEARKRSAQIIRAATFRRHRLAHHPTLEELESHELIWKPNWLLTGTIGDQQLKILVDGLNGGYYVVGS